MNEAKVSTVSPNMGSQAMQTLKSPGKLTTLAQVKNMISNEDIRKRFQEVLGKKAPQFLASITSLVSTNTNFSGVDPNTVMSAALIAATLDLPINPSLGFAYIIPYKDKATFQAGYKSFIQLALRTGQYKTINATEIYEGEIIHVNRLTGELEIDEAKRKSDKVVGYASFFKLINGFEKTLYMTVEQLVAHGKKFSKSYNSPSSLWKNDFHSMAMKTVLKMLLSKYGILSVEMQSALESDQGVIKADGTVEYVDASTGEIDWKVNSMPPDNERSRADDHDGDTDGTIHFDGTVTTEAEAKKKDDKSA